MVSVLKLKEELDCLQSSKLNLYSMLHLKKKREKDQNLSQELDETSMKLLGDLAALELESTTQEASILLGYKLLALFAQEPK